MNKATKIDKNASSLVYYRLLKIIIVGSYIPLGIFSFSTLITPLDIIYMFSLLFLVIYSKNISLFKLKYVSTILLSFGLYILLRFLLQNYVKGQSEIFPVFTFINPIILLYLFAQINEFTYLFKLFNFLILILTISMLIGVFGSLIGEPFASIRIFLAKNEHWKYFGRGDKLVGLDETIFGFGYTVGFLPLLLFIKYHFTKNQIYIYIIVLSILAIWLNGERSTLLFSMIFFNIFTYSQYKSKMLSVIIKTVLFAVLLFSLYLSFSQEIVETGVDRLLKTTWVEDGRRLHKQLIGFNIIINDPLTGGNIQTYEKDYYYKYGNYPSSTHNSYINVGMYAGVFGWLFLLITLVSLYKILLVVYKAEDNPELKFFFFGVILSFLIPMSNATLHNAGIFTSEKSTWLLLGFLISRYVNFSIYKKFGTESIESNIFIAPAH